jgi:hypothetical protein
LRVVLRAVAAGTESRDETPLDFDGLNRPAHAGMQSIRDAKKKPRTGVAAVMRLSAGGHPGRRRRTPAINTIRTTMVLYSARSGSAAATDQARSVVTGRTEAPSFGRVPT